MKKIDSITRRERIASFYIYSISFLGVIAVIFSICKSEMPSEPITLLLLAVFMGITEYFPIRIGRGGVTLSLTLIYPMSWEFGIHITVVACVCAMVFTHTLRRLPMQRTLFNCTQFAFSIILAEWVSNKCISFFTEMNLPVLYEELISFLIFTIFFCLINTLLYDLLMVLLPQPYSLEQWYKKNILLLLSGSFCLIYASLIYILEHRYLGELDGITVLFFFFPLVAICIISSFMRQIRIEKERLYNLFSVTTELSHGLSAKNLHQMKQTLQGFLGIQAYALWTKEGGDWMILLKDGKVHSNRSNSSNPNFEEISETFVAADWKTGMAPGDEIFEDVIRSLVYLPLKVNHELVGMFVAGKSRGASFIPEDIQSLSTFANQLGSLLKTRSLVSEQEKRMILEERNRLAREIHDGIAQVLAGVIFQLESSLRQSADQSGNMEQTVDKSIKKLRNSLGEVRYSIYALKPYPTQRLGLKQAIANKIQSIKQDYDLAIKYHERGRSRPLSFTKERVIFETLQESLQNIVKHAKADEVDILLSYQREHVLLKVKDNGVGFSLFESMIKTKHEPHYGILNMNEQAEKLGATLQIDSSIGKGTEITLLIPDSEIKEGYHDSSIISG
ncbi:GAF domain-containing sensor histidine kinase [Cytobacillus oceanisediminis]|uniref:GAF domain-containing sensor histidine kinase n=1 Tax=Cytobacillus oceanisediminis TaxID=665099 RepID=UPI001FB4E5A5|nr:GAF domain-containing sensor histidine kinase [Cytobacillus oceanisediminis]UOE56719.1 GAF domain-containing sensor histidine kinase [Cytobacillus oceanisediminis]